jgi:hypothetical protein
MAGGIVPSLIIAAESPAVNQTLNSTAGSSLIGILNGMDIVPVLIIFAFLAILIGILYIFINIPLEHENQRSYAFCEKLLDKIDVINGYPISSEAKSELIGKIIGIVEEPKNVIGVTRRTIALTILMIIGASVFLIVLISQNADLINTAITSLISIFATVVGFYFGGAQAKDILGQNPQAEAARTRPRPSIIDASVEGNPGVAKIKIIGQDFQNGAMVKIQQGTDEIVAKNVVITPMIINGELDLTHGEKGIWDVVVVTNGIPVILKSGLDLK